MSLLNLSLDQSQNSPAAGPNYGLGLSTPCRTFAKQSQQAPYDSQGGTTKYAGRNEKRQPIKLRKADLSKSQGQQADKDTTYAPHHEKIFQLENGYYLLYYHRPERWRMFQLYLKYLIPMVVLVYLIKKNPFYLSYPAMLPAMVVALIMLCISLIKYSKLTNMMIHQVHMDPTGTELTFIYQNQFFRRFRNDKPEQPVLIQQLIDPPQGDHFKPLPGDQFPKTYPVDPDDPLSTAGPSYFYRKYYITQRLFFSFAKRPMYCNYETMVNALNTKIIDLSEADIVMVKTSQSNQQDFEKFITQQDVNSEYQKDLLSDKFFELQKLERELTWLKHKDKVDKMYLKLGSKS